MAGRVASKKVGDLLVAFLKRIDNLHVTWRNRRVLMDPQLFFGQMQPEALSRRICLLLMHKKQWQLGVRCI
jgi:hypothetical protein